MFRRLAALAPACGLRSVLRLAVLACIALGAFARVTHAESLLEFVNGATTVADLQECTHIPTATAAAILQLRGQQPGGAYATSAALHGDLLALDPSGDLLRTMCKCATCCGAYPTPVGQWNTLPYQTQFPTGGVYATAHAHMLPTGQVLFFPEFDSTQTLLWDPRSKTIPKFSFPDNQPTNWLWCSHHVFISTGELLAIGGGGNASSGALDTAWRFDPDGGPNGRGWWSKSASMKNRRWYPTAVNLGDERVFVASGLNGVGGVTVQCEIYDVKADTWTTVTGPPTNPGGADKSFPETYPSLHRLPTGEIFFSRTGWHTSDTPGNTAWYFKFATPTTGEWITMTSPMAFPDRTEGMATQLLQRNPANPFHYDSKIFVMAGGDPSPGGRNKAEVIDVTNLTPSTAWAPPTTLAQSRVHAHVVLLPDGTVLGFGGNNTLTSEIYDPAKNTWTLQDSNQHNREYHSSAVLLPSGQVMTAGGQFETIEIFDPPYLFKGERPKIVDAPKVVDQGQQFAVEVTQAPIIDRVVLVRPMTGTHHTESEQRVLEMDFTRAGDTLTVTAPAGIATHCVAPRGWYMMFALNCNGAPSVAHWTFLR